MSPTQYTPEISPELARQPVVVDEPPLLAPHAPMVATLLAYLTAPLYPLTQRLPRLIPRRGTRPHNPKDILVPQGYAVDVVATDLNGPVHCTFDEQGACYVAESGYEINAPPCILRVDVQSGAKEVVVEVPREYRRPAGALTGSVWHDGALYFMYTDTLFRFRPSGNGQLEAIVTGLPGLGDHKANYPIVGPADGKLYFGVGTATNCGVVGPDNWGFGWLKHPSLRDVHDIPGAPVSLVGRNYAYRDLLGDELDTVHTGAYVPYGTETQPGQVVTGDVKCNGAILRCNPDGTGLERVAWGLRDPFGVAFHPDGRLFATEHDIDERGLRYIVGDPEDLYEIKPGAWYGWPDFAAGIRLDDPYWGPGGRGREPILREWPDPHPPKPYVTLPNHAGANGLDFCRDAAFGFAGDAFIACTGDVAPITTRPLAPVGFKVVRVDMRLRRAVDFAVNKIEGPASKLPHSGFERPTHCQFGPDGALYITDWGQLELAPAVGGVRVKAKSGTLWRIRRTEGPRGWAPSRPITIPLYGLEYGAVLVGLVGAVAAIGVGVWKLLTRR